MEKLLSTEVVGHQEPGLPDLIWVKGTPSIASMGLARILEREFRVHRGPLPPAVPESSSAVLCFLEGGEQKEDVASLVQSVKEVAPEGAVVVLSPRLELPLVCAAVSAGARGFLHTGMHAHQLARALSVILAGEMALPREILEAGVDRLNEQQRTPDLSTLRERQLEILELVAENLSNAQIAKRLYLSESTVKQHLGGTYRALGVKNRREASRIVRQAKQRRW
jgi:DNA-binding NarL/FixJ family response regulator